MKKLLSLVLAALMLLSFAACSGNSGKGGQTANATKEPTEASSAEPTKEPKMSKEEMLEIAVEAKDYEINNAIHDNVAKAQYSYCGKVLLITGDIYKIEADHICLNDAYVSIDVYLPIEDIVKLENRQSIVIVGETDDSFIDGKVTVAGTEFSSQLLVVRNAYLVSEYFELTGKLISAGGYGLVMESGSVIYPDFSQIDSSVLESLVGETVTFNAKRYINSAYQYYHVLIEIVK